MALLTFVGAVFLTALAFLFLAAVADNNDREVRLVAGVISTGLAFCACLLIHHGVNL